MSTGSEDVVQRLQDEIDGVPFLIDLVAAGEKIEALVEHRAAIPNVRQALLALGVPEGILELNAITDVIIPYPLPDGRLKSWMTRKEKAGRSENEERLT